MPNLQFSVTYLNPPIPTLADQPLGKHFALLLVNHLHPTNSSLHLEPLPSPNRSS